MRPTVRVRLLLMLLALELVLLTWSAQAVYQASLIEDDPGTVYGEWP